MESGHSYAKTEQQLCSPCSRALHPLHAQSRHICWPPRAGLHGDDTKVPILGKDNTIMGHIRTYVRDDRISSVVKRDE